MKFYSKTNVVERYLPVDIESIANLVETDKASCDARMFSWKKRFPTHHNMGYVKEYAKYMEPLRTTPVKLLEIGVLDHRFPLASVKMWMSYFKHIEMYCFDKFVLLPYGGIKGWVEQLRLMGTNVIFADQGSREDWKELVPLVSDLDFIIDDGSHLSEHILISLANSFKLLKKNGLYFIEDIQNPKTSIGMWGYNNADCYLIFEKFRRTGVFECDYLSNLENRVVSSVFEVVDIFLDMHKINYLVVLRKKRSHKEII